MAGTRVRAGKDLVQSRNEDEVENWKGYDVRIAWRKSNDKHLSWKRDESLHGLLRLYTYTCRSVTMTMCLFSFDRAIRTIMVMHEATLGFHRAVGMRKVHSTMIRDAARPIQTRQVPTSGSGLRKRMPCSPDLMRFRCLTEYL